MALVIRSVFDFTSSACKAVAHAILRDLTYYYWEKENVIIDQQNELSSFNKENSKNCVPTEEYILGTENIENGDVSKDWSIEDNDDKENNSYKQINENADGSVCSSADGYTVDVLGDNFDQNCYCKKELLKDLEVLKGNPSDFLIQIKCEQGLNEILESDRLNSDEKNNTESGDECGIHLLLHSLSSTIQNTIQTSSQLSCIEENVAEELSLGNYMQNLNGEIHETKIADVEDDKSDVEKLICEGHHQPITISMEDDYQKSFSQEKICSDEISSPEKNENTMATFENSSALDEHLVFSESANESSQANLENTSPPLEEGLKTDDTENSKLIDHMSEATGLIETFSDNDSDFYNEEWIKRFLSDALPQSMTKHEEGSAAAEVEGCECSTTFSCLQVVEWDDEKVELLTSDQLLSVETGCVSDWLYSVSPAICLLSSNELFQVTEGELQRIHEQETQLKNKEQLNCYENIIKNFYIEKWLDSTENSCLKSFPHDYGTGDSPLLKI